MTREAVVNKLTNPHTCCQDGTTRRLAEDLREYVVEPCTCPHHQADALWARMDCRTKISIMAEWAAHAEVMHHIGRLYAKLQAEKEGT